MRSNNRGVLICDACVLIDYADTNPKILSLVSEHIGPVLVTPQALEKTVLMDEKDANALGLTVIEPENELFVEAAALAVPLSESDHLIFLLAKQEGYLCWTNDAGLKKLCEDNGIDTYWGLEAMLILCDGGHLNRDAAIRTARHIHKLNIYITDKVLSDFTARIEEIFRNRK